ncbi:uncharacterized protein LOC135692207 [Rhopilema esculentum]|uniref:uncharacterized protein LOC135692207 n=1 Tax=Rhopilema esculentum TaxID=499914 RepID=UPI0031E2EE51
MGKHDTKAYKNKSIERRSSSFSNAGSSVKGHGFALARKRKFLKKYGKSMQRGLQKDLKADTTSDQDSLKLQKRKSISNELIAAREKFKEDEKAREQRKKDIAEAKKAHQEEVAKNVQKRRKVSKDLSKRTKKGQPVMKNQIMFMLDKIKSNK